MEKRQNIEHGVETRMFEINSKEIPEVQDSISYQTTM